MHNKLTILLIFISITVFGQTVKEMTPSLGYLVDKSLEKEIDFVKNHQHYWNRFLIPVEYAHIIPIFKDNLKVIYSLFNLDDNENFKINFYN
jgi:hypothetical protein